MNPMNPKTLLFASALLASITSESFAQYPAWQHQGSLYLLTTPDGANLPDTASAENFPLLVRLDQDFFKFSEAKPLGEDIRFSAGGKPLAYQIDAWDAAKGCASVWVRIPLIKGNARQEIKLHWGKPDAASESNGKAVFNVSNGYLSVWHMNDQLKDEIGTLEAKDTGTTATAGVIGPCRNFPGGKGINCGEKITTLPTGNTPHSTQAWFRSNAVNCEIVDWGVEGGANKVQIRLMSPPRIYIDSNGPSVHGVGALDLAQWYQVVHTYTDGASKIYVNGQLDATANVTMTLPAVSRLWLGGWYNNYSFAGDMDEVRISNVARPADWVRLEYENQKPMQSLVGPLVQAGNGFAVSAKNLTILEGKSATLAAKAGGAQKVYWSMLRGGKETLLASDRFHFTLDAGRVTGDESLTLIFKAVYPSGVKTINIPVTIKEDIEEPVFSLKAPAKWDGREPIEVLPQITNLNALKTKGAADINYKWTVSGIAVIKATSTGKLLLKRAQNSGTMTVTAELSNGGKPTTQAIHIVVKEPAKDAWVQRQPAKDEKPVDNQFYARDDTNEGTLVDNGTLTEPADSVFLKIHADDKLVRTETQKPTADKYYAFAVKLKPGLIKYKIELGVKKGAVETVLHTASNLVCGDAYIIQGQSNAEATAPGKEITTNPWIRSYNGGWGDAVKAGTNWWIGYWGMDLAAHLVTTYHIPICIINGAVGGTRIDQHQRNETSPEDPATIYGRLLTRVKGAALTHGIRGVLWHQGEQDQGSGAPTGDYDYKSYQQLFVDLSAAWKQDYPNIRNYYIYQIWPSACGDVSRNDLLREVQRTLPNLYSNMRIMTTVGIKPGSGCHYVPAGYQKFAELMSPLLEQDHYGYQPGAVFGAPNLQRAGFTTAAHNEITLDFGQDMDWIDATKDLFLLDGEPAKVVSGSKSGKFIKLQLAGASTAKTITYLKGIGWDGNQAKLLYGKNGVAALTFCEVPLAGVTPIR